MQLEPLQKVYVREFSIIFWTYLRAIFPKCLLLSRFLEVFYGIAAGAGDPDIFNKQTGIEGAKFHKLFRSYAHRPW